MLFEMKRAYARFPLVELTGTWGRPAAVDCANSQERNGSAPKSRYGENNFWGLEALTSIGIVCLLDATDYRVIVQSRGDQEKPPCSDLFRSVRRPFGRFGVL